MITVGMLHLQSDPEKVIKAYPYASVAKAEGIDFFYFTPGRVNFDTQTVNGLFYEKGIWIEKEVPFPDVIYNAKSDSKSLKSQKIIEKLRTQIPFSCYPIGNKKFVYEQLKQAGEFSQYLLETEVIDTKSKVLDFLKKYDEVVVKPISGRKGREIFFIRKENDQQYIVHNGDIEKTYNKEALKKLIQSLLNKENFIIQPFIECRTSLGLVYDFRLHVQKDGKGEWIITSIYPRIGASGSIKSNISTGGYTNYLEPFLKQEFDSEYFNMKRYVEVFALSLAKHMDEVYGISFDELGIDAGLDKNNKLWLYEINWHPGVPPVFYMELDVIKHSLYYCLYLAKQFRKQKRENKWLAKKPMIAVTGSAGKTTTKSMMAAILKEKWNVFESENRHNTSANTEKHIQQISPLHKAAVLEYGMGHAGVIKKHCEFIQPTIGIITNVGSSHIAQFDGDIKGIAKAKSELIHGMDQSGLLILNKDNKNSNLLETENFTGEIITIGFDPSADYVAKDVHQTEEGISFKIELDEEVCQIFIPIVGEHNVLNALSAIAVAHQLGFSANEIQQGLQTFEAPEGRLVVHRLENDITVIDDTCHATPEAMKSAIDVLSKANGKKIAILGQMPQLGDLRKEIHLEIGQYLAQKGIDYLYTVDTNTRYYREGAVNQGFSENQIKHFATKQNLHDYLQQTITENCSILVKGARFLELNETVNILKKQFKTTD